MSSAKSRQPHTAAAASIPLLLKQYVDTTDRLLAAMRAHPNLVTIRQVDTAMDTAQRLLSTLHTDVEERLMGNMQEGESDLRGPAKFRFVVVGTAPREEAQMIEKYYARINEKYKANTGASGRPPFSLGRDVNTAMRVEFDRFWKCKLADVIEMEGRRK